MNSLSNLIFGKSLKHSNLPQSKHFDWLNSKIPYTSSFDSRSTLETETSKIKHSSINLQCDLKTKNRVNLLILHSHPNIFSLGRLVEESRKLGFKSWVLQTKKKYGSLEEFEQALDFIKEKPLILSFGNWINFIQKSERFNFGLAVRPRFDLVELNKGISAENARKKTELEYWKKKQREDRVLAEQPEIVFFHEIPELSSQKPILLYSNQKLDHTPDGLSYPLVYEKKSFMKSEPFGCKELFLLRLLISFKDHLLHID